MDEPGAGSRGDTGLPGDMCNLPPDGHPPGLHRESAPAILPARAALR